MIARKMITNSAKKGLLATAAIVGSLTFSVSNAQAASLAPGSSVAVPGTTAASSPQLAGLVIQDILKNVTVGGQTLQLQDRVVQSNLTNQLIFSYRLINNTGSDIALQPFTIARNSFAGFTTDVFYALDGLGNQAPSTASRSADGSTVSFDFAGFTLGQGSVNSTRFFEIYTNALDFNGNGTGLISDSGFSFNTAQPTAVPTPALLPGLIGLGLAAFRKRKPEQTALD